MYIPTNVILLWDGLNSAIPSNFARETALDGKYIKGWGDEAVNTSGGAATHTHNSPSHTHTMANHTHTISTGGDYNSSFVGSGSGSSAPGGHSHNSVSSPNVNASSVSDGFTTGAGNNAPPYTETIFIKATENTYVPDDATILYKEEETTPEGFVTNTAYDNKYPKGAATDGDGGATGGSLDHSHDTDHNHTISHNHTGVITGGSSSSDKDLGVGDGPSKAGLSHTHSYTSNTVEEEIPHTGTVDGISVEPAYRKLRAIKNTSGDSKAVSRGMIALWLGDPDEIPIGWVLCDGNNGTPDMRNKFLKIVDNDTEVGDTGGSNTHDHDDTAHTHTMGSTHSHTTGGAVGQNTNTGGTQNQSTSAISTHIHNISSVSSVATSLASTNMTFDPADNQPPYKTVVYIMYKSQMFGGAGALAGIMAT